MINAPQADGERGAADFRLSAAKTIKRMNAGVAATCLQTAEAHTSTTAFRPERPAASGGLQTHPLPGHVFLARAKVKRTPPPFCGHGLPAKLQVKTLLSGRTLHGEPKLVFAFPENGPPPQSISGLQVWRSPGARRTRITFWWVGLKVPHVFHESGDLM